MKKNALLFLCIVSVCGLFACKKDKAADGNTNTGGGTTTTAQVDLLKDSVYLYSKEVYLWNTVLPSYDQFNPRQYTGSTDEDAATNVMEAIKKLEPLDRYSFVTTKAESDGLETGSDVDYGFFVQPASLDQVLPYDSVYWFVNYVYNASTAGQAGVQRGWYINKINGTQLGYDQSSVDILNNTFFGSANSAAFEFKKPDGSTLSTNLSKTTFTANSVLYKNVFTSNSGKKVGYFVFNQFFGDPSRKELADVFTSFAAAGINELIVDLRYNRGGATETQDTLANFIAPVAANGQKMYTYTFNSQLQQGNFPLLKTKPGYQNISFAPQDNSVSYEKAGSLNLSRVFFIVSRSTASASELLINNLKPYMDVKLIGDTTYGKPVGFFPIDIFDYSIYPISFKTTNSAGNADYYAGFAPDKLSPDGVNRNWGDTQEPCLYYALNYISNGTFRRAPAADNQYDQLFRLQQDLQPITKKLASHKFTGMFVEKK